MSNNKCYTIRFKKDVKRGRKVLRHSIHDMTKDIPAVDAVEVKNAAYADFPAGMEIEIPVKQAEIYLGMIYFREEPEDIYVAVPKCLLDITPPEGTKVLPSQARESLERYVNKSEPMKVIQERVKARWEEAYRAQFPEGKKSSEQIYKSATQPAIKARVSSTLTAQNKAFWEEADMLEPAFEAVQGKPEPKPDPKPEPVTPEEPKEQDMTTTKQPQTHDKEGVRRDPFAHLEKIEKWVYENGNTVACFLARAIEAGKLEVHHLDDGSINIELHSAPAPAPATTEPAPAAPAAVDSAGAVDKRKMKDITELLLQAIDTGVIDACDVGLYDEPEPAPAAPVPAPESAAVDSDSAGAVVDKRKMKEVKEAVLALASVKMEGSSKTEINKALQALVVKYSGDHKDIKKFQSKSFYSGKSFWQQAERFLAEHGDELAPVAPAPESATTATTTATPSWKDLKDELSGTFRAFNPELTQSKVNALIKKQLKALDCQPTGDARNASYWMDVYRAFNSADLDYEALATEGKVTQPTVA